MVTASRQFVCIRPATYESEAEAEVLKDLFRTRSGELENTVFVLLAPDGKTALSRSGRSPGMVFDDVADLLASLQRIHEQHPGSTDERTPAVPLVADVRRGLNIAACDSRPLIVLAAKTDKQLAKLTERVAPTAWSQRLVGQVRWAATTDTGDLEPLGTRQLGILVIAPGVYGLEGQLLVRLDADASSKQLEDALTQALRLSQPEPRDTRSHARTAMRDGIRWESAIPVTDGEGGRKRH